MTSFENLAEQIQESFSKTAAHIFLYHGSNLYFLCNLWGILFFKKTTIFVNNCRCKTIFNCEFFSLTKLLSISRISKLSDDENKNFNSIQFRKKIKLNSFKCHIFPAMQFDKVLMLFQFFKLFSNIQLFSKQF